MGLDKRYLFLAAFLILIVFGFSMYIYPEWKGTWWLLVVAVVVGVVGFIANFRQAFEKKEDKLMNTKTKKDVIAHPTVTSSSIKPKEELITYPSPSNSGVDFVMVTALPEELDAVLDKLPEHRQLPPIMDDIRTYFQVDLPVKFPDNSIGKYRIIVTCLLGMGRVQAVTATSDAIRRWRPRYILLVGIAGGMATQRVQVGDILISDQIVDYELQKLTPQGPEVRWDVQRADPRVLNACNLYRDDSWQESIKITRPGKGKPKRHTGPIASGDKVIAFSEILTRYSDVWPKLIGVEMEAAGVATAAFQSPDKPGFFMVRGVSDLANENKGSNEKWRSYASDIAASFAISFLKSGPVPLSENPIQIESTRVDIILEGEFSEFNPASQQNIVSVLAAVLKVEPNNIRVLRVYQGSIGIVIEMPRSAANRLYEMATTNDLRIMNLGIKSILVEGRVIIKLADKTSKIPGKSDQPPMIVPVVMLDLEQ